MTKMNFRLNLGVIMPLVLAITACSDSADESADLGLLKYVPADTPYVMVTREQLPDALLDKLEPRLDQILGSYQKIIRAAAESTLADPDKEGGYGDVTKNVLAVVDELAQLLSTEGLESAGINRDSRFAIFGHGLLPVMRLTLTDGALLETAFARIEQSAGTKMSTGNIDGHSYRYVGDDEWKLIVAIIDNEMVLTFAPDEFAEDQLKMILGLTLPDTNIAASRTLSEIASKYDFEEFMISFVDIEKLVATFLDEPTGINAVLLSQSENKHSDLDDVCRAEIQSLAGVMPRIVTGYTEISAEALRSKLVMELREDIASGVATITGAVPGLGQSHGGLTSIGMSFDLLALREFYSDRLDALEAEPFECELFAGSQEAIAAGREILNQPIPPIAYGFKGFLAIIDNVEGMDLRNDIPPSSIDSRLLISTDNANGLLAMGSMFSPEIAALNIEPGGDPVRLDLPQDATNGQTVFVAMSDNALALSVGEGMEGRLQEMLDAPIAEPTPFMSVDIDAAKYYNFIGESIAADTEGDLADMPNMKAALKELMTASQGIFSRFKVDVRFTSDGVEFESNATLND